MSVQLKKPLNSKTERVKDLRKNRFCWAHWGCFTMKQVWSNKKHKSIMTLCVQYREGKAYLLLWQTGVRYVKDLIYLTRWINA